MVETVGATSPHRGGGLGSVRPDMSVIPPNHYLRSIFSDEAPAPEFMQVLVFFDKYLSLSLSVLVATFSHVKSLHLKLRPKGFQNRPAAPVGIKFDPLGASVGDLKGGCDTHDWLLTFGDLKGFRLLVKSHCSH